MNHWDRFWENSGNKIEWERDSVLNSKVLKEINAKLQKFFEKNNLKDLSLLELGSGIGLTSYFFAKKGAKISLLDTSKEAKELSKKYFGHINVDFILKDLFKYDAEKKWDIVTSFGLCEHFVGKKREEILSKHINFLKQKGVVVISVPHSRGIFYNLSRKIMEATGMWKFGLEVPFSKNELILFAKENDFEYDLSVVGLYSSIYDLIIRKPLKLMGFPLKRRFDNTKSVFDTFFGAGIVLILYKE